MKINGFHRSFESGCALSSVEEHFLHTECGGIEGSPEPPRESERVLENSEFCPEFAPKKRARPRRLVRIARGLYRYGPTGTIYWCRTTNGKNVWRNLETTERRHAMAISAVENYQAGQNGNTEITVLTKSLPPGSIQPPNFLAHPPPQQPAPVAPAGAAVPVSRPAMARQGVSLNQLVERFRSESRHLANATRQTLDSHFKVATRYLDFERDVASIKLADMRLLKSKISEGRKPSTVNDIMFKAMTALFRIAEEDGLINRSPLEKLAHSRKGEPDRQQPSWEQSQQIVDSIRASSPETGVIIGFMQNFGVGQAEIQNLLGEAINVEAGVIHFRRKKTGKQFDVPIFPHAQPFIQALKARGRLQVGKPVAAWRNPRKALETACANLGLPSYEPRALRRCFIVHCLQTGIDPRLVAKWQGHRDAKLIFSVYGKFINRNYELAQAEKLGLATTKTRATGNTTAGPC